MAAKHSSSWLGWLWTREPVLATSASSAADFAADPVKDGVPTATPTANSTPAASETTASTEASAISAAGTPSSASSSSLASASAPSVQLSDKATVACAVSSVDAQPQTSAQCAFPTAFLLASNTLGFCDGQLALDVSALKKARVTCIVYFNEVNRPHSLLEEYAANGIVHQFRALADLKGEFASALFDATSALAMYHLKEDKGGGLLCCCGAGVEFSLDRDLHISQILRVALRAVQAAAKFAKLNLAEPTTSKDVAAQASEATASSSSSDTKTIAGDGERKTGGEVRVGDEPTVAAENEPFYVVMIRFCEKKLDVHPLAVGATDHHWGCDTCHEEVVFMTPREHLARFVFDAVAAMPKAFEHQHAITKYLLQTHFESGLDDGLVNERLLSEADVPQNATPSTIELTSLEQGRVGRLADHGWFQPAYAIPLNANTASATSVDASATSADASTLNVDVNAMPAGTGAIFADARS